MARMNEFAGRTNKAWLARYAAREAATAKRVEELRAAGINAEAVEIVSGGPGVQGGIKYMGGVAIDGKRVSRKRANEALAAAKGEEP